MRSNERTFAGLHAAQELEDFAGSVACAHIRPDGEPALRDRLGRLPVEAHEVPPAVSVEPPMPRRYRRAVSDNERHIGYQASANSPDGDMRPADLAHALF